MFQYIFLKISLVNLKVSYSNRGSVLSIISGLLYGFSFAPVLYIKNNYGDSQQGNSPQ